MVHLVPMNGNLFLDLSSGSFLVLYLRYLVIFEETYYLIHTPKTVKPAFGSGCVLGDSFLMEVQSGIPDTLSAVACSYFIDDGTRAGFLCLLPVYGSDSELLPGW